MNGDDDAVFDVTVKIQKERIRLKLLDRDDVPVVERRLIQADGVVVTVAMPVHDVGQLQRFVDTDPYRAELQGHLATLVQRYVARVESGAGVTTGRKARRDPRPSLKRRQKGGDELGLFGRLDALATARSEGQLYARVHALLEQFEIPVEQFIFAGFRLTGESRVPAAYRYFGACDPQWLQLYMQRRWYMIDPFYSWAMAGSSPMPGSQLVLHTSGQRDFYARLQASGFDSCLVAPARMAQGKLFGVFIAGNAMPTEAGERALLRYRQVFRALAAELLDWSAKNLARKAIAALGLTDREIAVLNLLARGQAAPEIAMELGVSANRVYKEFYPELTFKMQVDHISKALAMALELGMVFSL